MPLVVRYLLISEATTYSLFNMSNLKTTMFSFISFLNLVILECTIDYKLVIMIPITVRYNVESKATIYLSLEKVCQFQAFFLFTLKGRNK